MKYLILGAGPAGLSFANRLQQLGETSFLVLEKESEGGCVELPKWMEHPLTSGEDISWM